MNVLVYDKIGGFKSNSFYQQVKMINRNLKNERNYDFELCIKSNTNDWPQTIGLIIYGDFSDNYSTNSQTWLLYVRSHFIQLHQYANCITHGYSLWNAPWIRKRFSVISRLKSTRNTHYSYYTYFATSVGSGKNVNSQVKSHYSWE